MACFSVAVTSTKITQVVLSQADMKDLLASLLKASNLVATGEIEVGKFGRDIDATVRTGDGYRIEISQQVYSKETRLVLTVDGYAKTDAQKLALRDGLTPVLDKLAVVAQQKNVLSRLAQLGKLSQVKAKDNGVVARLEITI